MEDVQRLKRHVHVFDFLFILSFIFGFITLLLTQCILANGGQEVAPVTSAAIYQYDLDLVLVFTAKWAFLFATYYIMRSGSQLKTQSDAVTGTLFFFMLFSFCFINMWNDLLIYIYHTQFFPI